LPSLQISDLVTQMSTVNVSPTSTLLQYSMEPSDVAVWQGFRRIDVDAHRQAGAGLHLQVSSSAAAIKRDEEGHKDTADRCPVLTCSMARWALTAVSTPETVLPAWFASPACRPFLF